MFAAAPGVVALAQPGGFGDVAGDAYYSEPVAALTAMGVFEGTECDGGFCPREPIDRKTMAVWTVRVVTGQDPPAVSLTRFDDVDAGSFYAPFVERMAQLRITLGCGDGTGFCPDNAVTRAQMAAFLSRAFSLPDGPDPGFADVAADAWYAAEVAALAASGITRGCGDGTVFCPGQDTTRAQMATFLHRGLGWAVDREAAAVAASRAELSAVPGEAAVTPHRGQVSVSWPATEALAGSPVAGYEVQWRARGEAWDPSRRAVLIGLSYEVGGLSGGAHEIRVRPAIMERAEIAGASIVSAQGSAPTAALVAPPVPVDEASNVSAFDGVVNFEMTGEPVWPATIELPVDMAKIEDDDFIFLMWFNEEYQIWLPEPGAVFDRERGVVTAEVHHLTYFDITEWFIEEVVPVVGSGLLTIEEVGSDVVDTVVGGVEVIAEGITYVWDEASDSFVYVVENGHTFLVNTYAETRDVALDVARAVWEATKWVGLVGWDAFVKLVEKWVVERLTFTEPPCSNTEPRWVTSVETPEDGAPLIVCPEAVGAFAWFVDQDLRLKVTSQRHYPMLLTARDAASSKIKISPTNDNTSRVRVEQTESSSTLVDVTVAWYAATFDTGQTMLPAGATHWLRIPRSAVEDPPSMTLDGMYNGPAANLNTAMMGVDLLANISGIPIDSGDVSQLHGLSNEAAKCFSLSHTTTSTQQERWRSFNKTTTCLVPVYLQALKDKVFRTLLSPVIFLLEAIVQLAGYLEALADIATGKDTPTTTIHAKPSEEADIPPDDTASPPTPTAASNAVTAGSHHSCGLKTDATITCWGWNRDGQTDAPSGTFNAVTAGWHHTCGLKTDATITCWGSNHGGQTDAPSGTFNAVTAGAFHTCGLKTDATITCWGWNDYGQTDAPSGTFNAVTAGWHHTCRLKTDATITCWGWNRDGQTDAPSGTFNAVTAGAWHTCGLKTDATITCWGSRRAADAPSGTFNAVTAGGHHTCGLKTDATITCWGHNDYGQADAPSGTFNAVTAGNGHTCGLKTDATITCWGWNDYGQADAPNGTFGPAGGGGPTVTVTKGGPGPTVLGPGQGVPCGADTPTCRYLDIELSGFAADTYTIECRHDGWGDFGPSTFWTFTITVDATGTATRNGPCFLNFAKLTANGAYVTVSRTGTTTATSNWLK